MRPAILPALPYARHHVMRLISNVCKNSNTYPLYPDTMPLKLVEIVMSTFDSHALQKVHVGAFFELGDMQ